MVREDNFFTCIKTQKTVVGRYTLSTIHSTQYTVYRLLQKQNTTNNVIFHKLIYCFFIIISLMVKL